MAVGICLHLQWEQTFKDMGIAHTNWRIKSEPSRGLWHKPEDGPNTVEFHSQAWPQSCVWCRLLGWTSSWLQAQAVSVVQPSLRPGQAGTRQRCISSWWTLTLLLIMGLLSVPYIWEDEQCGQQESSSRRLRILFKGQELILGTRCLLNGAKSQCRKAQMKEPHDPKHLFSCCFGTGTTQQSRH